MRWELQSGDILDVQADVLVCSANIYLNLSGGVGGAFLLRYGPAMQDALHEHMRGRGLRHLQRGEVVVMDPCGSPYHAVIHAVAVDGAYTSSAEVVAEIVAESLRQAAVRSARSVALTALATGYGRLPLVEFARGIRSVIGQEFPPIVRVVVGLHSPHDVERLRSLLPHLT